MPVFGVNDRRQPAVSVISTGTKWSGEISLRNGTSCIVAGDFSTQSINRTQTICRQNRHAAPLEMTVEWAACPKSDRLRSDCLTSNFYLLSSIFYLRPPPLSFRPERSEVEKSHSEMVQASCRREISRLRVSIEDKTFTLIPPCSPARNDSSRDAVPAPFCFFPKCLYTARRPCHFDRKEVEWRNLTPKRDKQHCGGRFLGSEYQ